MNINQTCYMFAVIRYLLNFYSKTTCENCQCSCCNSNQDSSHIVKSNNYGTL